MNDFTHFCPCTAYVYSMLHPMYSPVYEVCVSTPLLCEVVHTHFNLDLYNTARFVVSQCISIRYVHHVTLGTTSHDRFSVEVCDSLKKGVVR